MQFDSNTSNTHQRRNAVGALNTVDFDQQCLRILRCTARAMAAGDGGLRFKPGTRVWLEGLAPVRRKKSVKPHIASARPGDHASCITFYKQGVAL
jgi:hypothetical protein